MYMIFTPKEYGANYERRVYFQNRFSLLYQYIFLFFVKIWDIFNDLAKNHMKKIEFILKISIDLVIIINLSLVSDIKKWR